jgi:hypothetical protein
MHKTDPQVWSLAFRRKHTTSIPCTVLARKGKKTMMLEEENYTRYISVVGNTERRSLSTIPHVTFHPIFGTVSLPGCIGCSVSVYVPSVNSPKPSRPLFARTLIKHAWPVTERKREMESWPR